MEYVHGAWPHASQCTISHMVVARACLQFPFCRHLLASLDGDHFLDVFDKILLRSNEFDHMYKCLCEARGWQPCLEAGTGGIGQRLLPEHVQVQQEFAGPPTCWHVGTRVHRVCE